MTCVRWLCTVNWRGVGVKSCPISSCYRNITFEGRKPWESSDRESGSASYTGTSPYPIISQSNCCTRYRQVGSCVAEPLSHIHMVQFSHRDWVGAIWLISFKSVRWKSDHAQWPSCGHDPFSKESNHLLRSKYHNINYRSTNYSSSIW
jgi:hypothetical protein